MVRVRYSGLRDAYEAFRELEPYRKRLIEMACRYRPFSTEYVAIHEARIALDRAAEHFTGDPEFYALKPPQSQAGSSGSGPA